MASDAAQIIWGSRDLLIVWFLLVLKAIMV